MNMGDYFRDLGIFEPLSWRILTEDFGEWFTTQAAEPNLDMNA